MYAIFDLNHSIEWTGAGVRQKNVQIMKNLGMAIEVQRKNLGLTQGALAELAGVGPNYVRQIEQGKTTAQISKVLDVLAPLGLQFRLELGKDKIFINTGKSRRGNRRTRNENRRRRKNHRIGRTAKTSCDEEISVTIYTPVNCGTEIIE